MRDGIKALVTARKSGGRVVESRDLAEEYAAKELTRRQLVQGAIASAVATWLGGSASGCGDGGGAAPGAPGPDGGAGPIDAGGADVGGADVAADAPAKPKEDVPAPRGPHLVGLGYHEDHAEAVRLALAETVGLSFVRRGQRVYLKVNSNSGDPYPYSTSPEVIRLLVGMLRDLGAEVFLGDRSFWGDPNTQGNLRANGIAAVARELDVPLLVFGDTAALVTGPRADATGVDWMDLPAREEVLGDRGASWEGPMRVPVAVARADHIINLPTIKTHFIATFTMSLKNVIGIINPVDRSRPRNLGAHDGGPRGRLYRQLAYMNKALPTVSMNVLDGHRALVTGGPIPAVQPPRAPAGFAPRVEEARLVAASVDRVAADVTGLAILRTLSPAYEELHDGPLWQNRQIAPAARAGIGIAGPAQYDLSGPSVPDLARYRSLVTG